MATLPVNPIIGDESWICSHGEHPGPMTNDRDRVRCHLQFALDRMRRNSTSNPKRECALNALQHYVNEGEFPQHDAVEAGCALAGAMWICSLQCGCMHCVRSRPRSTFHRLSRSALCSGVPHAQYAQARMHPCRNVHAHAFAQDTHCACTNTHTHAQANTRYQFLIVWRCRYRRSCVSEGCQREVEDFLCSTVRHEHRPWTCCARVGKNCLLHC